MNDFFTVHNRLHEEIVSTKYRELDFCLTISSLESETQKSPLLLEGQEKEEKCYTIIFWVILLFFHLPHNSKGNFSPLFIFTLNSTKKKKGIFLRFKTLLQFYRGKFHCKSSKSLVSHTNQEKEGFLLICPPVPISSHITKLVLGFYKAMKAFISL